VQPITQKFIAELIDRVDGDMKVWSVYANTHVGWCVSDLTPIVLALQRDGVPFFGPVRRADGMFQLCSREARLQPAASSAAACCPLPLLSGSELRRRLRAPVHPLLGGRFAVL
jgi:hypothetical protein